MHCFLDPNISNCQIPFPTVSSFGDCSHAYTSCNLWYLKHYDLKNVKQVLHIPITILVTSYCLTITYDRAGFGYESLRYYVQKDYVFSYTSCMSTPLDTADRLSTPRGEQYQTSLNILRWMYNTKKRSEWNSSALSPTRKQKCPSGGRGTERTV